jgi:exodeoxyribonuclease V beta subunit
MANFDPIRVRLEGSNIVEASAGTGKTFSIGLLVLRLLMEKKIPIEKILMVTFTNAAVAELAARIRLFIAKSIKVIEGGDIKEEDIKMIVEQYRDEESLILLRKALSDLDEASIQTIHSFCQDSLNMYALDSGQPFGLELQPDVLAIADDAVKNFWRQHITGLPEELLREIEEISFENLEAVVKETIGGKKYAFPEEEDFLVKDFVRELKDFEESYENEKQHIVEKISSIQPKQITGVGPGRKDSLEVEAGTFAGYCDILTSGTGYKINLCESFFLKDKETLTRLLDEKNI